VPKKDFARTDAGEKPAAMVAAPRQRYKATLGEHLPISADAKILGAIHC
jgi:hypothetical protein